jgi:lipoprotein-anchoring transpeptidase ErfK/SrfK
MQIRLRSIAAATSFCVAAISVGAVTAAPTASAQGTASCPDKETKVAVFNNGKKGSTIQVYKGASLTSGKQVALRTGINVYGRIVFNVIGEEGDFFKVAVPARPNGSTGYVKKSEVVTYVTPFRILIALRSKTLKVFECGNEIMSAKIAIGKKSAPTPVGNFFLVDLVRPKKGSNGPYGAYAMGISGYSNVYQRFGGGDGRIGIHGTNEPAKLGQEVSSGCVRLDNANMTKLAKTLFLGSPVIISDN